MNALAVTAWGWLGIGALVWAFLLLAIVLLFSRGTVEFWPRDSGRNRGGRGAPPLRRRCPSPTFKGEAGR